MILSAKLYAIVEIIISIILLPFLTPFAHILFIQINGIISFG